MNFIYLFLFISFCTFIVADEQESSNDKDYDINISFYPSYEINLEENQGVQFLQQDTHKQEIYIVKKGQVQFPFRKQDMEQKENENQHNLVSHVKKFSKISQFRIWKTNKSDGEIIKFGDDYFIDMVDEKQDKHDQSRIIELYELVDYYNFKQYEDIQSIPYEQSFYIIWDHQYKNIKSEEDIYKITLEKEEDVEFYVKKKFQKEENHAYFQVRVIDGENLTKDFQPFKNIQQPLEIFSDQLKIQFIAKQGSLIVSNFNQIENDQQTELDEFIIDQFSYKQLDYEIGCDSILKQDNGIFNLEITGDIDGYDSFKLEFLKKCNSRDINNNQSNIKDLGDLEEQEGTKKIQDDKVKQTESDDQKNQEEIQSLNQKNNTDNSKEFSLKDIQIFQPIYTDKEGYQLKGNLQDGQDLIFNNGEIQSKFKNYNKSSDQQPMTYMVNIDMVNFFIRNQNSNKKPIYFSDPTIEIDDNNSKEVQIITKPEIYVYSQRTFQQSNLIQDGKNIYQLNYINEEQKNRRRKNKIQIDFNCQKPGTQTFIISLPILIDQKVETISWKFNKQCGSSSIDSSYHIENSSAYLNIFLYIFYAIVIYIAYKIIKRIKKMISSESQEFQQNADKKNQKDIQMTEQNDLEEQTKLKTTC